MTEHAPEMIDLVFDLEGGILHRGYPFALWGALVGHFSALADEPLAGILPLRLAESSEGMLLPKRAKLALRLPAARAEQAAAALQGRRLEVNGSPLQLGAAKKRPIQPSATVHAQIVVGAGDEVLFMEHIKIQLEELQIAGHLICGLRSTLDDGRQSIHGFSLVIHDLKPEASMQLQYAGLGDHRRYGCGIFVPYKAITGLEFN
ncbi:MAG TPA: type I-MYXAN CRISPR-associated protein Cas6/Cmx6 [Gallionella sp.]|nr:type I-MYXAN CRISPR-associated protein Cas6/Cmx6 [Gallionella sp.]